MSLFICLRFFLGFFSESSSARTFTAGHESFHAIYGLIISILISQIRFKTFLNRPVLVVELLYHLRQIQESQISNS